MHIELTKEEESYIKGIDSFLKIALSLPSLSVSLSTACLAFEIYYLQHVYQPGIGIAKDLIAIIPIIAGGLFLVAAAWAIDWVIDSISPAELRALNAMHGAREGKEHVDFTDSKNGWNTRVRLYSGGYLIFCLCIGALLFLLTASILIFLRQNAPEILMRSILVLMSLYFSSLVVAKMLTNNIRMNVWRGLVYGAGGMAAINIGITAKLLNVF